MDYKEKLLIIRQIGGDVHFATDDYWCDCGELYDRHILTTITSRGNSVEEAVENCWKIIKDVKYGQCIYSMGRYVLLYKDEWVDIDFDALQNKKN